MDKNSDYDVIKSNVLVNRSKEKFIKINQFNKQKYIKIEEIDIGKTNSFISRLGGDKETAVLLEKMGIIESYVGIKENAYKLILKLANSNRSGRERILMQNKSTYENLNALRNDSNLSKEEKSEIDTIIFKIESFL